LTILLSVLTILIYSEAFHVKIGADRAAHYCEFINEIINSIFALIFAFKLLEGIQLKIEENDEKILVN
jgi:hypothetical protein